MSYKVQPFPISSASEPRVHGSLSKQLGEPRTWPTTGEDVKLFRSWLVYDSNIRQGFGVRRVNWNTVRGLALATAISVGIWAGLGLMFARIWK
jgi:hypothetical protein